MESYWDLLPSELHNEIYRLEHKMKMAPVLKDITDEDLDFHKPQYHNLKFCDYCKMPCYEHWGCDTCDRIMCEWCFEICMGDDYDLGNAGERCCTCSLSGIQNADHDICFNPPLGHRSRFYGDIDRYSD